MEDRDLRIDAMRGIVMCMLVCAHIDIFSVFNFLIWERLGILTSAEGFVMFSGLVLGIVHQRTVQKENGLAISTGKLVTRALSIYKANILIVVFILLLMHLTSLNLESITTFRNWAKDEIYPLFPTLNQAWHKLILDIALLKHSPHQVQVLGFYVVVLMLSPIVIFMLKNQKWHWVLFISFILYCYQATHPSRPSGAQFEYTFPIFTWQFLFFGAMVIGYYFNHLKVTLLPYKKLLIPFCIAVTLSFLFYAWNSPSHVFPDWAKIQMIKSDDYYKLYWHWFSKKDLGLLRIVNNLFFWATVYWVLTISWDRIKFILERFFIPIGQNSLYVFIMHLPVLFVYEYFFGYYDTRPAYYPDLLISNTLIHVSAIFILWLMVRNRFLFGIIPR